MSDSKQSRKINRFFAEFIAKLRKWLNKIGSPVRISRRFVRQLLGSTRGRGKGVAGFVLPTVTLVTLVVTLLVVTTVSRSSERAQTAANARQEQVFRSAATPIIDRARAKIDALLSDGKLPRTTPPELTLDSVITSDSGKYTLPDETRLQLVYDFRGSSSPTVPDGSINVNAAQIENREYVSTAWKFPVDTDNNGKFDSYGLYSILFRTRPPTVTDRPISPIESRTLPMDETTLSGACISTGDVTNIASDGGWTVSSDNRLRKSFFVYAVTLPITDSGSFPDDTTLAASYETYNGVASVSAVELQQDRARSPQNNNAVFFEGDTELVNIATFRINGRIYSAGNLMVGAASGNPISFYQVSSSGGEFNGSTTTNPDLFGSCYYEKKNSEIAVAGNVVEGNAVVDDPATLSTNTNVSVDLFRGQGVPPDTVAGGRVIISDTGSADTSTVSNNGSIDIPKNRSSGLAVNDFELNRRIGRLVDAAIARSTVTIPSPIPSNFTSANLTYSPSNQGDPTSVREDLFKRISDEALSSNTEVEVARRAALTAYFGERTRKVSFRDVPFTTAIPPTTADPTTLFTEIPVAGQPADLAPPIAWMLPSYANSNYGKAVGSFILSSGAGFDGKGGIFDSTNGVSLLTLSSPNRLALFAADPIEVAKNNERFLGDRVLVGNGLPAKWLKLNTVSGSLEFVGETEPNPLTTNASVFWNNASDTSGATVSTSERYRVTRSTPLSNLGVTDRGGFWEISAALDPSITDPTAPTNKTPEPAPRTGGLRVVTNAGIYSRDIADTFLPRFRTGFGDDRTSTDLKILSIDESSVPLWNGQAIDNPITDIDETKFAQLRCDSTSTAIDKGCVDDGRNYVVWSDSMPMSPAAIATDDRKGDLQMRATAIYHYANAGNGDLSLQI